MRAMTVATLIQSNHASPGSTSLRNQISKSDDGAYTHPAMTPTITRIPAASVIRVPQIGLGGGGNGRIAGIGGANVGGGIRGGGAGLMTGKTVGTGGGTTI